VAGLERPAELEAAPLRGPAELRRQLLAWEPEPFDALLAPPGATAELVALDPPATFGGDFHPRAFRRAWLTLTTADGRGLLPGTLGQAVVPPGTVAAVIFREAGRVDGPAPQAGLERLFLQLLGPDVEQLHADLVAQIEASGNLGRRADEPAALDPLLRPAFWRFYGFRQRARDLDAQFAQLAGLDAAERAELVRLVATVRDQAFRDGAAIGVALQARGLQQHLGADIADARRARKGRRASADALNDLAKERALRIEQALYAIWRPRREVLEKRKATIADILAEILLIFAEQQAALAPRDRLELPKKKDPDAPLISDDRGRKMLAAWRDGHDPIARPMTWEDYRQAQGAVGR